MMLWIVPANLLRSSAEGFIGIFAAAANIGADVLKRDTECIQPLRKLRRCLPSGFVIVQAEQQTHLPGVCPKFGRLGLQDVQQTLSVCGAVECHGLTAHFHDGKCIKRAFRHE